MINPPLSLKSLSFDNQDASLFLLDDLALKSESLKYAITPRLTSLVQLCTLMVNRVYGIDVLTHSTISQYPNFRSKRLKNLAIDYQECFAGLGGKRSSIWTQVRKKDGRTAKVLPFRLGFALDATGLTLKFDNAWLEDFHQESVDLFLKYLISQDNLFSPLYLESGLKPRLLNRKPVLNNTRKFFQDLSSNRNFKFYLQSNSIKFPIKPIDLVQVIDQFIIAYPIYESLICLSQGQKPNLKFLFQKLSTWLINNDQQSILLKVRQQRPNMQTQDKVRQLANKTITTTPSIRWQVFQRDQWKCVSCGHSAHDGAILHVDHIIPRSLGGKNCLENYQTLCHICNIGKSNKDSTNLRNRSN